MTAEYLPRAVSEKLRKATEVFPVVVVSGARQAGKSTLVRHEFPDRTVVSLDDVELRDMAVRDPERLLALAPRLVIDEVQRAPDLLLALKSRVDQHREPGQFIVTGSANLLLMKQVSDSLAGRAGYLDLAPMTLAELAGQGRPGRWDPVLDSPFPLWAESFAGNARTGATQDWGIHARLGGFPYPAHRLEGEEQRNLWFEGYVRTYLERDLRDLSAVEHLAGFRRLMTAACLRVGGLLNQAELGRDIGLAAATTHRYLSLLETSHQLIRLQPFSVNRTKRLTRSPRIFWRDVGLALYLAGDPPTSGAHFENLLLNDLLVWAEQRPRRPAVLYWRTASGREVDFVVEHGRTVVPIEVKAGRRIRTTDLASMKLFLAEYPDMCPGGLVVYGGNEILNVADRLLAVPWWRIL